LAGDPDAHHAGTDPKAQRRLQMDGLAVDARGDELVGIDLKRGTLHWRQGRCGRCRSPVGAAATVMPSSPSSILGRVPEPTARPRR